MRAAITQIDTHTHYQPHALRARRADPRLPDPHWPPKPKPSGIAVLIETLPLVMSGDLHAAHSTTCFDKNRLSACVCVCVCVVCSWVVVVV
ncbi:MAG: hypothetical protein ACPIOQ_10115, partial [Promethearchaeia archaeon]